MILWSREIRTLLTNYSSCVLSQFARITNRKIPVAEKFENSQNDPPPVISWEQESRKPVTWRPLLFSCWKIQNLQYVHLRPVWDRESSQESNAQPVTWRPLLSSVIVTEHLMDKHQHCDWWWLWKSWAVAWTTGAPVAQLVQGISCTINGISFSQDSQKATWSSRTRGKKKLLNLLKKN